MRWIGAAAVLATVVLPMGCGSALDPASGGSGLARKIEFAPRYNIERAMITVFRGDGFELLPETGRKGTFRFVREGDALGQKRFGDWFESGVFLRAEVTLSEVEFGTHRISCVLAVGRGAEFVSTEEGARRTRVLLQRVKKLAGLL